MIWVLIKPLVFQESENEIEDEVDILMSSDIVAVQMSTRLITFNRTQTGFFFKEDKTVGKTSLMNGIEKSMSIKSFYFQEMVGPYQAEFYSINGLALESRKRREHLTQEDLRNNKALIESLTKVSSK